VYYYYSPPPPMVQAPSPYMGYYGAYYGRY